MANTESPLSAQDLALFQVIMTKRQRGPKAIQHLRTWGDQSVALLAPLIDHDDLKLRSWAIFMLGQLHNVQAIPVLLAALDDSNSYDAVKALASYGSAALAPLLTALPQASDPQRMGILQTLGILNDLTALPALCTELQHTHPTVRALAADALGQLGDRQATDPLLRIIDDATDIVRRSVIDALGNLRDPLVVPALLRTLHDRDLEICFASIAALAQIGEPQSVVALIPLLAHENPDMRARIAQTLGTLGNPQAVPPLLPLLSDEATADLGNPLPVNVEVSLALGELGDPRAVDPLIHLLQHSDQAGTRWAAVTALGQIGDSRARSVLEEARQHDNVEVSWGGETVADAAAQALIQINQGSPPERRNNTQRD